MRIKIGTVDQFKEGEGIEKRILARGVAVFMHNGKYYGIQSDCKHMRAPLVGCPVKDGVITCKWHSWTYDLETGKCLSNKGFDLKTYDVEIKDGSVFIDI